MSKFKFKTIMAGLLKAVQKGEIEKRERSKKGGEKRNKNRSKKTGGNRTKKWRERRLSTTDRNALANHRNLLD